MSTGLREKPWLLADIGGTNARFAIQQATGGAPEQQRVLACADHATLTEAVEAYLITTDGPRPKQAAMAIATPVTGDHVRMTNHHWSFSIEQTRRALHLAELHLLNDFTAQALAVPHLAAADKTPLGGDTPAPGCAIAVLGPGTGLGVSGLLPAADGWIPLQGEGGHVSFSPATDLEIELLRTLRQNHDHVSAERVVSGMGIANIHGALVQIHGQAGDSLSAPVIVERARQGDCELCLLTLRTFAGILGNVTGNLVLTLGARGGFYICGGIVPRLGALFDRDLFRQRFEAHGRFSDYLAPIPGTLVTAAQPALMGLARGFTPLHAR
ncbi:glucokinase [Natronocella acetinitrilica]|uniref:Glucokinase n=1 Tax=Natronocella acetinitrilica TaxID=414046 RepID=A0AAE3KG69_9GAMM|nr:glucokinase [Natronocella acetinitrilica]MCP1674887.1 glucokinase [Natronocella acetinitrilica]